MNLAIAIAVYASMSRELGLPLRFPGKAGAYDKIIEMTDAGLLARATVWAATDERCANQAFNITNGDLFRWNEMWPKIASSFGIETAPPLPMSLDTIMADKQPLWDKMKARHGLADTPYADVSSWRFADFVLVGTTISSPTAPRRGVSASTTSSTPRRCSCAPSVSCASAGSSPDPTGRRLLSVGCEIVRRNDYRIQGAGQRHDNQRRQQRAHSGSTSKQGRPQRGTAGQRAPVCRATDMDE